MFLSRSDLLSQIQQGRLVIQPFSPRFVKGASCVLHLGGFFRSWTRKEGVINPWKPQASEGLLGPPQELTEVVLSPGDFLLGATEERLSLPHDIIGFVFALSHWTRFGLILNGSSLLVGPGYGSDTPTPLTIEIGTLNPGSISLRHRLPICQLVLAKLSSALHDEFPLARSIYEGLGAPCPPLLYEEFHTLEADLAASPDLIDRHHAD